METKSNFFLSCPFANDIWDGPIITRETPTPNSSNGIFAFKKAQERRKTYVSGWLDLWGTIIVHERGYRAEKARVFSLEITHEIEVFDVQTLEYVGTIDDLLKPKYVARALERRYRCSVNVV